MSAAAAPLVLLPELGPPGWIALGVIGIGATGCAGYRWYTSSHAEQADTKADTKLKDAAASKTCATCPCERVVIISRSLSPQAVQHIQDAQAAGQPRVLTLDRPGADARRAASLRGIATAPGMDRDEYPPATFLEGGEGASVRLIPRSDNRSAGGQLGAQLAGARDGCKITITVEP